jgi:hypothetical protein
MHRSLLIAISGMAFAFSVHAHPTVQLSSVADVESALGRGVPVSVVLDLAKCVPAAGATAPGTVRGGLKIDAYRILADGTLSFADGHATVDRSGQPIWQFLRYQVKPDQAVTFTMDVFSLPSYTRKAEQISYACTVNQGIAFFMN